MQVRTGNPALAGKEGGVYYGQGATNGDEAAVHDVGRAANPGEEFTNSIGMKLMLIPAGTFTMGSDSYAFKNENPLHQVTLTQPYRLGVYEVTQAQYEQVMGTNPSSFKGTDRPVENVSWEDAVEFCRRLSDLPAEKAEGRVYRLPTEAEWEYACRAGTATDYSFGDDANKLGDFAWFAGNEGRTTHPVGQKRPNPWGLYDMHGNVWEWCSDRYGEYPQGSTADPTGLSGGLPRVMRGGCWGFAEPNCRSAFRDSNDPSNRSFIIGFRLALNPSGVSTEAETE